MIQVIYFESSVGIKYMQRVNKDHELNPPLMEERDELVPLKNEHHDLVEAAYRIILKACSVFDANATRGDVPSLGPRAVVEEFVRPRSSSQVLYVRPTGDGDYVASTNLIPSDTTAAHGYLCVLKRTGGAEGLQVADQIYCMHLPDASTAFEALHNIVHLGLAPYMDLVGSFGAPGTEAEGDERAKGFNIVRKKLTELDLSLVQLQSETSVPTVELIVHPVVLQVLEAGRRSGERVSVSLFTKEQLDDSAFINALQNTVTTWVKACKTLNEAAVDPPFGSTLQEINYWNALERAFADVESRLDRDEIMLTLAVLRHAKRFHATISFKSDVGLSDSASRVRDYNHLLKDFPIQDLFATTSIEQMEQTLLTVFGHLNRRLRISSYPISRAISLVEAVSIDFQEKLSSLIGGSKVMFLPYLEFEHICSSLRKVARVWDDQIKEFTNMARELTRRRSERFVQIKINSSYLSVLERVKHLQKLRAGHSQLLHVLQSVSNPSFKDLDLRSTATELEDAYNEFRGIDVLDTSSGGSSSLLEREKAYNEKISNLENLIILRLKERLESARSAPEMFKILSSFNSLFVRRRIQAAVREYQIPLIDSVSRELLSLRERYTREIRGSQYHYLMATRGLSPTSAKVLYVKQLEKRLELYMSRIESALGEEWTSYSEGQKLYNESKKLKSLLNAQAIVDEWYRSMNKEKLSISGFIFCICRDKTHQGVLALDVDFDPRLVNIMKETRLLHRMGFLFPNALVNLARDTAKVFPFATSLSQTVKAIANVEFQLFEKPHFLSYLVDARRELRQLLMKGARLKWESFVHTYASNEQFKAQPAKKRRPASRHIQFLLDLNEKVHSVGLKLSMIESLFENANCIIKRMQDCQHSQSEFVTLRDELQDKFNSVVSAEISNAEKLRSELNGRILTVFKKRAEISVNNWIACFRNMKISKVKKHIEHEQEKGCTFNNITHHLVLAQNKILIQPPIEDSYANWLSDFNDRISKVEIFNTSSYMADSLTSVPLLEDPYAIMPQTFATYDDLVSNKSMLEVTKEILETKCSIQHYAEQWFSFQALWRLNTEAFSHRLGRGLREWNHVLDSLRKSRALFGDSDLSRSFGVALVSYENLQERISERTDYWISYVLSSIYQLSLSKGKELYRTLCTSRLQLEETAVKFQSVESLIQAVDRVFDVADVLDRSEQEVADIGYAQRALIRGHITLTKEWVYHENLSAELAALRNLHSRRHATLEGNKELAHDKLKSEVKIYERSFEAILEEWQSFKSKEYLLEAAEAIRLIDRLSEQVKDSRSGCVRVLNCAKALGFTFTVNDRLEIVEEEIRDYKEVWNALLHFYGDLEHLKDSKWSLVDDRELGKDLISVQEELKKVPVRLKQYVAFERIRDMVASLLSVNGMIVSLRSIAMKERHWKQLFSELGLQFSLNALTLGDVWSFDLKKNKDKVQEIIDRAHGELGVEEFLKQISSFWSTFKLEKVQYKNKAWLVRSWDEVFQRSTEHLNALQVMKSSLYYSIFQEEAESWQEKLKKLFLVSDELSGVQQHWTYLDGIITGNKQIENLLPIESGRFATISAEFVHFTRQVSKCETGLGLIFIPNCVKALTRISESLAKIQKSLGQYLEKERSRFPRLYFIGDIELLELLGNGIDGLKASPHLRRLFPGIRQINVDSTSQCIEGVESTEFETVKLAEFISINDENPLKILPEVDSVLKRTLRLSILECAPKLIDLISGHNFDIFDDLLQLHPCQVINTSLHIAWTNLCENAIKNVPERICEVYETFDALLRNISAKNSIEKSPLLKRVRESIITNLVSLCAILKAAASQDTLKLDDHFWLSQLRFYLRASNSNNIDLEVKLGCAKFSYGFEYQGVQDPLVRTRITNDAFRVFCEALRQGLGGAPFGPAGTGKTETVKALGALLGQFVMVFNCDSSFDSQGMDRILNGVCQIGAWACFDEFNRLNETTLSAVSQKLQTVQSALLGVKPINISLGEFTFPVNQATGLFITMNPNYIGRSSLPSNLRRLFRAISMNRPDTEDIARVLLYSKGFDEADSVASLLVPLFSELPTFLSHMKHYDFGLRAMKSVLKICGKYASSAKSKLENLEMSLSKESQMEICVRALRESICPKLVTVDTELFENLLGKHFGEYAESMINMQEQVTKSLNESAARLGYELTMDVSNKLLQSYNTLVNNYGIMLYGPSGCGKSTARRIISEAYYLEERKEVKEIVLDPKAIAPSELYGYTDPITREWHDGIFTSTLRSLDKLRHNCLNLIVFDGDLDPLWAENLNSVLDDNRLLTLPTGERLPLPDNTKLVFEVDSLQFATPATVTRCSMVWFDGGQVTFAMRACNGMRNLSKMWKLDPKYRQKGDVFFQSLERVSRPLIMRSEPMIRLWKTFEESNSMAVSEDSAVDTLFAYLLSGLHQCALYEEENVDLQLDAKQIEVFFARQTVLGILWALGSGKDWNSRSALSAAARELFTESLLPEISADQTIFDYHLSLPYGKWEPYIGAKQIDPSDSELDTMNILVPTLDTKRHGDLIYNLINSNRALLLCGPAGSGKTMIVTESLRRSKDIDFAMLNFSSDSTPELVIKTLEQYCAYRHDLNKTILAPAQEGRRLVVFCDEINLVKPDEYGTQRIIMLLRQILSSMSFWNCNSLIHLENVHFVAACNPPHYAGRSHLPTKFLRYMTVLNVGVPSVTSLNQIYLTYMRAVLRKRLSLLFAAEPAAHCMVEFYMKSSEKFNGSQNAHYVYSPRELTRWTRGMYLLVSQSGDISLDFFISAFMEEALRLFGDRLVLKSEKEWTHKLIQELVLKHFPNQGRLSPQNEGEMLLSNWTSENYDFVEVSELIDYVRARSNVFEDEEACRPPIITREYVKHMLRVDRIFKQKQGHMMLVAESGCDLRLLAKFVAWMNGLNCFQIRVHKNYKLADFDADLRRLILRAGCYGERICFMLDDSQLRDSSFLERMNSLLANSEVPGLFEGSEYKNLLNLCKEGASRLEEALDTEDELLAWLSRQVQKNLHAVFLLEPNGAQGNVSALKSPALYNRCVINWLGSWTDETLKEIALSSFEVLDLSLSRDSEYQNEVYERYSEAALEIYDVALENIKGGIFTSISNGALSPANLFHFLDQFSSIYEKQRVILEDRQRYNNNGLDKLDESVEIINTLSRELDSKKGELQEKNEEANLKLQSMVEEQREAEEKRIASISIEKSISNQKEAIAKRQNIVMQELDKAMPAVLDAQKSVSNIKKQHLTEVRSMSNPPEAVRMTMESVCTLLGTPAENWRAIQQIIRRDDFITNIVHFDGEKHLTKELRQIMEENFLSRPEFTYEIADRASKACGPLLQWVIAQVNYAKILESVHPLELEVQDLQEKAKDAEAHGKTIADMILELEESIAKYRDEYAVLIGEVQALKSELGKVTSQIDRSRSLIQNLSAEKARWSDERQSFGDRLLDLMGDSLICAAKISYACIFEGPLRLDVYRSWVSILKLHGIPHSDEPKEVSELIESKGLHSDEDGNFDHDSMLKESLAVASVSMKCPLFIDPDGIVLDRLQAALESKRPILASFLESTFFKQLESAIRFGSTIVLQDAEYLDPVILPILANDFDIVGGRKTVNLAGSEMDVSPGFKIFMLSRSLNMKLSPYVSCNVTIINCALSSASLHSQVTKVALQTFNPTLLSKKYEVEASEASIAVELRRLESGLLTSLNESQGNILDDNKVMTTLEALQRELSLVKNREHQAKVLKEEIIKSQGKYMALSNVCCEIFDKLSRIGKLNAYYHFSLNSFLEETRRALAQCIVEEAIIDDISATSKSLVQHILSALRRSLKRDDFRVISLLLVLQINSPNSQELKDFVAAEKCSPERELSSLSATNGIGNEVSITSFQEAKSNYPACMASMIDTFLSTDYGLSMEEFPSEDLKLAVHSISSKWQPIALCTSDQQDVSHLVENLAVLVGKECTAISLGSKEAEQQAEEELQALHKSQKWLLLKNVHYSAQWLPILEQKLSRLKSDPDFRVFYTIDMSNGAPPSLIQNSKTLVFEKDLPFKDLLYETMELVHDEDSTASFSQPVERARLVFLLSYCHTIFSERTYYQPGKGWDEAYIFDDADFKFLLRIVDDYIGLAARGRRNVDPSSLPWLAIQSCVCDIAHGAKMSTVEDKLMATRICRDILVADSYDEGYNLCNVTGHELSTPLGTSADSFFKWIKSLPSQRDPAWAWLDQDVDQHRSFMTGLYICDSIGQFDVC